MTMPLFETQADVIIQKQNKRIAELEDQVKVLTFISHPVEYDGHVHRVGHVAKTMIDERDKRIVELEEVLTKLNNIGGLGLDKHKWIEEALKGGAE